MSIHVKGAGGSVGQVSALYVKDNGGQVVPVRRVYVMHSTYITYPDGPGGAAVTNYLWKSLGEFVLPWRTPPKPNLTFNPSGALTSNDTRVLLPAYQADGDERREWWRQLEYHDADNPGVPLRSINLGKDEEVDIQVWAMGTSVQARAAYRNSLGLGPWSPWSQAVTTNEP